MKQVFDESELILNDDGSVYHLCLRPEDIADTIILVGDQDRVPQVSMHFDRIELKKQKREFVTHTGFIGNQRISVLSTGIGTDNIDIVLNELDALVNIDLAERVEKTETSALKLIRLGTSGALQADIEINSLVFSRYALGLDGLLQYYASPPTDEDVTGRLRAAFPGMGQPYLVSSPGNLHETFSDLKQGITVTCSGFYGPQGRHLRSKPAQGRLLETLAAMEHKGCRVTNLEMETAGIYGMAALLGHEAASVNVILANRVTKEFSTRPAEAMVNAIRLVLERIGGV